MKGAEIDITEISPSACELIRKNLLLNHCGPLAQASALDWNRLDTFLPQHYDLILGSDVLYQACFHLLTLPLLLFDSLQGQYAEAIARLLQHSLKPGGVSLVFCPGRGYAERLERLVGALPGFSATAYYLDQVKLLHANMAELHIVATRRDEVTQPKLLALLAALDAFLTLHSPTA